MPHHVSVRIKFIQRGGCIILNHRDMRHHAMICTPLSNPVRHFIELVMVTTDVFKSTVSAEPQTLEAV